MKLKIAILMDPIEQINTRKDSSYAMLLEAQRRGHQLFYMQQQGLMLKASEVMSHCQQLSLFDCEERWFELSPETTRNISEFDVILMRKDPPFDMEFVYTTYLLQLAKEKGVLVVNDPQAIRDANEKLFTAWFPQCCTDMIVSRNQADFRAFYQQHRDIILKPLDGMGGSSIFRVKPDDPNLGVIIETLTANGQQSAMAQKFIPQISDGDKRILMVDGEPIPYCLARIPAKGETRGNLAAGGRGEARPLNERDFWIAGQIGPTLKQKGLMFVGLDVIGDYVTEINVTSPTCIREIDAAFDTNIAGKLLDAIESRFNEVK